MSHGLTQKVLALQLDQDQLFELATPKGNHCGLVNQLQICHLELCSKIITVFFFYGEGITEHMHEDTFTILHGQRQQPGVNMKRMGAKSKKNGSKSILALADWADSGLICLLRDNGNTYYTLWQLVFFSCICLCGEWCTSYWS